MATTNLRNTVLDKILRNEDFTIADVFLSLHTGDPGESGAAEATGGGYERQSVLFT
jgi:hypothetical protein